MRNWRRLRAVELLAESRRPETIASMLGCARSSVYAWAKAWREKGLAGLREAPRSGRERSLDRRAELLLEEDDSQKKGYHSTGWTGSDAEERACEGQLPRRQRAHRPKDAEEAGFSLEATEVRARQA